ncbi:MAG: hypothetical protein P4L35_16790 [Ignavibacteriaceae bacterium]|nr:hypothetical protein [Ignavibacteriaceae bacterium]
MVNRKGYWKGYYFIVVLFMIPTNKIIAQDNTNNKMIERSNIPEVILDKKIKQDANYYSSILKTELNLTNSQMKYIYDMLVGYYSDETETQTTQQAALRENEQYSNIERDPLMHDASNIKTDTLMQNINNLATTTNNVNPQESNKDEVLTKIGGILDNDQMYKWINIKNSWWGKVNSRLSDGKLNLNDKRYNNEQRAEYEDDRDYENYDVYYPGYDFK